MPASDSSNDETQLHFFNKTQRGQLKVCKALGPGSADLIGQKFYFDIYGDNMQPLGVWITAQAQTQCVIVGNFPIGSTVDVEETCGEVPTFQPDDGSSCNEFIDTTGGGEITIAPGINTKTITNTAKGLLEICKHTVRGINTQPTFTFRIDGAGMLKVRAGTCSLPQRVSVGTHTVSEIADQNYELDPGFPILNETGGGIIVSPADREVSRSLANRTVTVNVPYGPNGETLVTFYNRVKLGQVKVCKTITPGSADALGGKPFNYFVIYRETVYPVGPIYPGECQFAADSHGNPINFPVIDSSGNQTVIGVHELDISELMPPPPGSFYVTGLSVTGTRGIVHTNCVTASYSPTGVHCLKFNLIGDPVQISFNLGPSVNVVTFLNSAGDP